MNTNTENTSTEQAEGLSMGQAIEQGSEGASEQAASLAALVAQAGPEPGQEGAQQGAEGAGQQEPERVPLSVELADAIAAGVTLLAPVFPTLERVYTQQTVQRLAVATERVCVKRGWLQNGLFGGASEELMLAAVVLPVALSTWAAVKADLIAARIEQKPWLSWVAKVRGWFGGDRREREKAQAEAMQEPGAASVTVGTVAPA